MFAHVLVLSLSAMVAFSATVGLCSDQDPGHVTRLRTATEACWHKRHPVVVDHRPGRCERARPWSYPRQPADTIGARRSALSIWLAYYQLRQLRPLVQSMTVEAASIAAAAFISCRLDYCNSLLYGLPDTLLRKLQYDTIRDAILTCARKPT